METVRVSTSQHIDIDYPVAGLGERIAARLIDWGVFLGLYISFIILSFTLGTAGSGSIVVSVLLFIALLSYAFYNLVCEIFMSGQSIGKRVMKIKVISLDGGQPTLGQYFIRWIFRLVDFVLTFQVGGVLCIILSDKKQRIGDIVAGTTLIKTVQRTKFENIAFHSLPDEDYIPVFGNIQALTDRDMELVHEVIAAFYKTSQFDLLKVMSDKVARIIGVDPPRYGDEMDFLNSVIKDYNQQTSSSA
jgi:uncharacterized RDD family membrane protein YckC